MSLKDKEYSVLELRDLIIEYIRLMEELLYPNYFKKPGKKHLYDINDINLDNIDLDDVDA